MEKKRELLFSVTKKDLEITLFSGTGCGGQHRNKHKNSVRLRHPESGVMVTAQRERSKEQNMHQAFIALTEHPKFKAWHRLKCAQMMLTKDEKERQKREMEEWVEKQMSPDNISVEVLDLETKKWISYKETEGNEDEIR